MVQAAEGIAGDLQCINARSDGVATNPMFREAFKRRRCIVPMSGFYEWRQMEDGKQPFFISDADGGVLSCAGLWDNWKDRATGETMRSATLIVTDANTFMSQIHDRMPVFLPPDKFEAWLDGSGGVDILTPAPHGTLRAWPVSPPEASLGHCHRAWKSASLASQGPARL